MVSRWCILVALFAGIAGCQNGRPEDEAKSLLPTRFGKASVAGRIMFYGTPPENPLLRPSGDAHCREAHPGGLRLPEITVGSNGEVADVFIYVKLGLDPSQPTEAQVVLDQKECLYQPRVLGVQVGQPLAIRNTDATLHNVRAAARSNRSFNRGIRGGGKGFIHRFTKPEIMVKIRCDVHSWMVAYVGVVAHPFFAVTGLSGKFEIHRLPPGQYVLGAWHEKLGSLEKPFIIRAQETVNLDFTYGAS